MLGEGWGLNPPTDDKPCNYRAKLASSKAWKWASEGGSAAGGSLATCQTAGPKQLLCHTMASAVLSSLVGAANTKELGISNRTTNTQMDLSTSHVPTGIDRRWAYFPTVVFKTPCAWYVRSHQVHMAHTRTHARIHHNGRSPPGRWPDAGL